MRFRSATRLDHFRQAVVVFCAFAHFALPQLPFIAGFGRAIGSTSGAQSPAVPPSWAFMIWGVIFAWTLLFAVWQALPGKAKSSYLRQIAWWCGISMALSALWSIAAVFGPLWSTLPIMATLYIALAITVARIMARPEAGVESARWLAVYPFQFFFGWITLALPANLASTMIDYDLRPFNSTQDTQALFVFAVAALLIYAGLRVSRAGGFYSLAVAWGAGAILFDNAWADWRPIPAMGAAALVLFLVAAERWVSLKPRGGFQR